MANFTRIVNGVLRTFAETGSPTIYDASVEVGSTITAGTSVTLPASATYTAAELEVWLNSYRMEVVKDYNYVGSPPRTQIQYTFDLVAGDTQRFRIDRPA